MKKTIILLAMVIFAGVVFGLYFYNRVQAPEGEITKTQPTSEKLPVFNTNDNLDQALGELKILEDAGIE